MYGTGTWWCLKTKAVPDFMAVIHVILVISVHTQYIPVHTASGTSGILYTWYKAVHDGMYWYVPVRTLLGTWRYEKTQNGTYQYVLT